MVVRPLCDALIRAGLLAGLALPACSGDDDDGAPAAVPDAGGGGSRPDAGDAATGSDSDAATGKDGGPQDAGDAAGALGCTLSLASKITPIVDPEVRFPQPSFAWTGEGVVGVWPRFDGNGYRVLELDRNGATTTPLRTLWPEEPATSEPSIAVHDGVLAIADRRNVGANGRAVCRIALIELNGGPALLPPKRINDVPDDETGLNQVGSCQVAATANGFAMVWLQLVDVENKTWELFTQGFDEQGQPRGERSTFESTGDAQPITPLVRSDGTRALVVQQRRGLNRALLTFVEADEIDTVEVELDSPTTLLDYGHGSFLLRTVDRLHFFDSDGKAMREPAVVGLRARFAPLGMGYVSLSQEEFVIARAYDSALRDSTLPVSLSDNRAAIAHSLVYAPDGESSAAIVMDVGAMLYVPFTCKR